MALRDSLGSPPGKQKRWNGLGQLLDIANQRGHFSSLELPSYVGEAQRAEYLRHVAETRSQVRNDLAHGSSYLNMPGATLDALRDCAALINCLYPRLTP